MDARRRTQGADAATPASTEPRTHYAGQKLDRTPPPDHEAFVEVRARGLQALRQRRTKRKRSG